MTQVTLLTLALMNVAFAAKLGSGIVAFVDEFGEYDEVVEREKEIQYVWILDGREIILNIGRCLSKASIQLVDYRQEDAQSLELLLDVAKQLLPKDRFESLNWSDIENHQRFIIHDKTKDTTAYYEWHTELKKSQFMLYVKNLNDGS